MKDQSLRALMVDDSEDDVQLIIHELEKGGYNPVYERAETAVAMKKALQEKQWDIILCDYKMPQFNVPSAIAILKDANIDTPLIIVSGAIGEEIAVECMRLGAHDYIMKANLSRLCPAIARELEEAELRNKKKLAEEELRLSEEKERTILENIEDGYYETDLAGNYTFYNDSLCRIHGYTKEELMGMNNRQYTDKEYSKKLFNTFNEVYRTGKPAKGFGWQIIRKDGTKRYIEASVTLRRDSSGKPIGFRGITRDITERRTMEEEIRQSEERYRTILDEMENGYFEVDLAGNYTFINDANCHQLGYSREEMLGLNFRILMVKESIEIVKNAFTNIYMTGKPQRGISYRAKRKDGTTGFAEISGFPLINKEGEIIGFRGMAFDITEHRQAEEKLRQTLDSLKKAVGTTIQVLVSALESRDPYTAGHQFRVADLACAIATEMGLAQEKINGIQMAGSIHDIGKLSIPVEILSKPTKLTDIEFSMIKEHSQIGYDILKDVESPWPLAEIVYQHHERINGSGYPRKLKGDEIIIEARIMAVADVVEAMASHRPYRAALGIEMALEEIKKNKGIIYDNVVADTCLGLFLEKGYRFP